MQVNLDGQSLPVRKLKGTDTTLDLSRKKLRDASAIVLAALLRHNTSLTSLSIASNPIGEDGLRALGTALLESTVSKHRSRWNTHRISRGPEFMVIECLIVVFRSYKSNNIKCI